MTNPNTDREMRCAECDCANGGADCNWIAARPNTDREAVERLADEMDAAIIRLIGDQARSKEVSVLRALVSERDELQAGNKRLREANTWQPIETVPYDLPVLFRQEDGNVFQDFIYDEALDDFLKARHRTRVSHWTPVPHLHEPSE